MIRTARRMGLRTVAVYSEADAQRPACQAADEARLIGPARARDSYLNIERIIAAAKASGAEAIHPGYGFLSEKRRIRPSLRGCGAGFRRPAAPRDPRHGLEIGGEGADGEGRRAPGARLSRRGAGRGRARARGEEARLSGAGQGRRRAAAARACASCAATGELEAALAGAKREAKAAFGDDRMLIEKFVEHPRHIEVQVFGDSHGNHRVAVRARMHAAAPPPEGDRGGAVADARRTSSARRCARRRARRRRPSATSAPARSNSWPTARCAISSR